MIVENGKKLVIVLPDSVLQKLTVLAHLRGADLSGVIGSLIDREYSLTASCTEAELAEGYRQMGLLNSEYAEAFLAAEYETIEKYEETLSECESI